MWGKRSSNKKCECKVLFQVSVEGRQRINITQMTDLYVLLLEWRKVNQGRLV